MLDYIDSEEVEAIRAEIEQSLPSGLLSHLRRVGIALTLGSSTGADSRLVVVGQDLADELAESELAEEMVTYRKDVTGVDNTVFISPKGNTRHAARIKLAITPPDSVNPNSVTASIAIADGTVVAGTAPQELVTQAREFINLNRDVLMDYWEYRIDTEQLRQRLQRRG